MNKEDRAVMIQTRLQQAFSPTYIEVIDESNEHLGHTGHGGAGHFSVIISADSLKDLPRLEAHRKIYAVLSDLIPHEIHALKIKIY